MVLPEVFLKAVSVARNFGHNLDGLVSVNVDKQVQYRSHVNVLSRPASEGIELTGGRFCDVVIEAVGKQWPLDLAAELAGERGRLIIAGYHQDGLRQVNMQLWNWRGLDVINAHQRDLHRNVQQ